MNIAGPQQRSFRVDPDINANTIDQLLAFGRKRHGGRLILQFPNLPPAEQRWWQNNLNRINSDCGCSMGAVFLMVSVFAYFIYCLLGNGLKSHGWIQTIGMGLAVAFLGAILGKAFGLAAARIRLRSGIRELIKHLTDFEGV